MKGIRLVAAIFAVLLIISSNIALAQGDESRAEEEAALLSAAPDAEPGPEVVADRTASSQTFRLPDGSLSTRIYQSSINYETASGQWKPIDNELEEGLSGGFTNAANSFDLSLPEHLGAEPVRLARNDQWVSYRLLGPMASLEAWKETPPATNRRQGSPSTSRASTVASRRR